MREKQEDFKWFGEGFEGFPKHLPDDCVEYTLHIIDPRLDEATRRTRLRQVQQAANTLTKELLKDFIWQRQKFNLELIQSNGVSFLHGQTNYGDSVEDEWLIVYILRELSKQFLDVWIRAVDPDGEFLLIEAANVLPPWLNPEVAKYRLWLNEGKLLIIPMQERSEKLAGKISASRTITMLEAFRFIEENRPNLIHSTLIEAEAFYRLQKYPKQIEDSLHTSLVIIPRKLAFLLRDKAAFISPAVEAFYLRDPIALRPLQRQDSTKLIFSPHDLVTVPIKFTKVGYAQLKSQQFPAPLVWESHFLNEMDEKAQSRIDIGMKITSGFEMLISDPQNVDHVSVREIKLLLQDLETGECTLPSDTDISQWGVKEDDDGWLDIDFEDFESELAGKNKESTSRSANGFGDKNAQENLRKMVARFENFLNDDSAGAEDAQHLDDMDNDDDDDDDENENHTSNESDIESEDKDVSFDEDHFTNMMREMMGMPADTATSGESDPNANDNVDSMHGGDLEVDSVSDEEVAEIRQVMQAVEAELEDAGALHHRARRSPDKATRQSQATTERLNGQEPASTIPAHESDTDDDLDINFNLAKNLLESFKSQGGAAGPSGNLMGLLGLRMPRDEDENRQHM